MFLLYYLDNESVGQPRCVFGFVLRWMNLDEIEVYIPGPRPRITKILHPIPESNDTWKVTLGDIPYFKTLKKYLIFLGQYPQQTDRSRKTIFTVLIISIISLLIPILIEFYTTLCDRNTDGVLEVVPVMVTNLITTIKIVNLNINREQFRKLYDLVIEEWETLKLTDKIRTLDAITEQGSKVAQMYRTALLTSLVLFTMLPLLPTFLDIVLPLNETRLRPQLFKLNYLVDGDEYFYPIYLHSVWSSIVCVVTIVTVDSMNMLITHHACGLFAICGIQIKRATDSIGPNTNSFVTQREIYQQFKDCTIVHKKAIQFYELIDQMNRKSFLLQIGLNMMGISVTAVQTIMNLDQPGEALRIGLFFGTQKFHLFFISLPGQKLVDYSLELATNVYNSKWYQTPVKMQKVLYMMQIRSGIPCTISAGGLYDMNIENFGAIFKSCMSYFTMLLSLRD
ncbi:odorant receptor 47a-like [Ptiloglossa arizonensis]|uniref:odorant receptor 47a-like n=1 Tax=Ptiloglossa arizonensis TaxID=3350558 RepID=UPI003FA0189B